MIQRGKNDNDAMQMAQSVCQKVSNMPSSMHNAVEGEHCRLQELARIETKEGRYGYYAGVAIAPSISKNGFNYRAEELEKAYPTLEGQKVFPNHDYNKPPFGRVIHSGFREDKSVVYVMEIDEKVNPEAAASIESGYIDSPSIGADAKEYWCDICNEKWLSERCKHYEPNQEYADSDGVKQICTVSPRGIIFKELSCVFFTPGIEKASILQKSEVLPVLIEKFNEMNETKRNVYMETENARLKIDKEKLSADLDDEKRKHDLALKEKEKLQKDIEVALAKTKNLQDRIYTDKCKELAIKESEAYPSKYKPDDIPDRVKRIMSDQNLATIEAIEIRIAAMTEKIDDNKQLGIKMKEIQYTPAGKGIALPPTDPKQPDAEVQQLERKRTIECSLNINKPLGVKFREFVDEYGLVFGTEQGIQKKS